MGINAVTGSHLGMPTDDVQKSISSIGIFPEYKNNTQKNMGTIASVLLGGGESTYNLAKQGYNGLADLLTKDVYNGPMTSAEARAIASQHYKLADELGGNLTPKFTNDLIDKTIASSPQTLAGQATVGDTPLAQLAQRWQVLRDKPLNMQSVQEMDTGLTDLINNHVDPKTGRLLAAGNDLNDVQTTFRNMIQDANPSHVVGGTEGFDSLQNARKAWSQAAKMSDLERIQTRAMLTDNPSTGFKSGVRTLLSNPSRIRGYSPEELAAVQEAGDRGLLGGTLHVFGSRLAPLGAALIGEHVGGPIGAMLAGGASHAVTTSMRNAATNIQAERLAKALQTIGSNVPVAGGQ
jgi:hypothetical protein